MSRRRFVLLITAIVVAVVIVGALIAGLAYVGSLRRPLGYPWALLIDESRLMKECAACHAAEDFHTCETCHDAHGSAELAELPFNDLVLLTGDVPTPGYIPTNEILPYRDRPGTHVELLSFLADRGVHDFESVTLASRDGGFVTFDKSQLTEEALLMPHVDGMRFAAENLHVSTWLKGVWRIVVVGRDRPLRVDDRPTSIGRLLLGQTRSVTIEETAVMLRSATDGEVRKAQTASRIEGVALADVLAVGSSGQIVVRDSGGREVTLTAQEADGAMLALLRDRPAVVLVLPGRSRAQWVTDVVEIRSGE